jgi:hypothetical protein
MNLLKRVIVHGVRQYVSVAYGSVTVAFASFHTWDNGHHAIRELIEIFVSFQEGIGVNAPVSLGKLAFYAICAVENLAVAKAHLKKIQIKLSDKLRT